MGFGYREPTVRTHASPSAGRTNTSRSASKVAPEDHIVRLAQLIVLLQTKATKPQHATAKWLCISVAWAEEIRFLSTAPLSVGWRRGRICARNLCARGAHALSRRPARGCGPSDSRPTRVCRASNSTAAPPHRPALAPHRPALAPHRPEQVAALAPYPRSPRPRIRRSVRRRRRRFRHARDVPLRAPRCWWP